MTTLAFSPVADPSRLLARVAAVGPAVAALYFGFEQSILLPAVPALAGQTRTLTVGATWLGAGFIPDASVGGLVRTAGLHARQKAYDPPRVIGILAGATAGGDASGCLLSGVLGEVRSATAILWLLAAVGAVFVLAVAVVDGVRPVVCCARVLVFAAVAWGAVALWLLGRRAGRR